MTTEANIIETITNLFKGADERNWEMVKNAMANTVLLDYSSMGGGPAANTSAEGIIDSWKGLLPGFDKTHHHVFDFDVATAGDNAQAHFSGKADHFLNDHTWTVAGTYDAELANINGKWKVTEFSFNMHEQSGDTSLPSKAMEVVKKRGS